MTISHKPDTTSRVVKILVENLAVSEADAQPDTLLSPALTDSKLANLGADSLDVVELVMAIEDEFEIRIPDDEAEKFCDFTVAQLVDAVHTRRTDVA